MPTNKTIHITYIGRLVQEKGIEIVIDSIKRGALEQRDISWHICGDGDYREALEKLKGPQVNIYGHIESAKLTEVLGMSDLVLMPSLFLETFGLVALETLMGGIPVCGFARGGLKDFVHPSLALDPLDPVDSFFRILDSGEYPILDVSAYSYSAWMTRLEDLTKGSERILLINDYTSRVGGAEAYMLGLQSALLSLEKQVEVFGYPGPTNRLIRIFLMAVAPLAFWRKNILSKKIQGFHPDILWMHSLLRYIGPHGLRAISEYNCKKYITHHDLGLISPRPSQIYREEDIPPSCHLGDWIPKKIQIFTIISALWKWTLATWIWQMVGKKDILHLLPSAWMVPHFQKYIHSSPVVFPHTSIASPSVK